MKTALLLLWPCLALAQFSTSSTASIGSTYPNWQKYTMTAIANGVSGCANANGCWQVNGGAPVNKSAALTQSVTLFQLPANGNVASYRLKTAVACTGTTTLTATLGTASSLTFFSTANYDLKAAVSVTNVSTSLPTSAGSDTAAAVNAVLALTATVANIDQIAAGCSVTAWLLWGVHP